MYHSKRTTILSLHNLLWSPGRIRSFEDGLLGLRTLTVIRDTIELVKNNKDIEIDIHNISLDDSGCIYNDKSR